MEQKINIFEILRDAPHETRVYSPIFGYGYVTSVSCKYQTINVTDKLLGGTSWAFDKYGHLSIGKNCDNGECVLFPYKEFSDWSAFRAPWRHKHFKPFERVLVRKTDDIWRCDTYSHFNENNRSHVTTSLDNIPEVDILPYEGNEDLVGKKNL